MIGKDLKHIISMIPDDAWVIIDGNWKVCVEGVKVEVTDEIIADIQITEGFSITKDSTVEGLLNYIRNASH